MIIHNLFFKFMIGYSSWFPLLIPLPLLCAFFLSGKLSNKLGSKMGSMMLGLSFASLSFSLLSASALLIMKGPMCREFVGWGPLSVSVYFDTLSAVMVFLVNLLTIVIIFFSKNYLSGNAEQGRFFKWISTTLGSVLLLVVSGNLGIFFIAWIAVSLSLHKLLTFYHDRYGARVAARKKFLFSRLGDLALLGALAIIWYQFGTFDYKKLFQIASLAPGNAIGTITFLLVFAAVIKSALFPFHSWLPDTMETPTPVSALMHAGIINAGGYLIIRLNPLIALNPMALQFLLIVGGFTALFGSIVMITQTSIKRSLAFSTIAQMGFMMFQCGLGAFALAFLHIIAHSLYKAYSFLASGGVISQQNRKEEVDDKNILKAPHLFVSFATSLILTFGVGCLFKMHLLENAKEFYLALILVIALSQNLMLASASSKLFANKDKMSPLMWWPSILIASFLCFLFFGIHKLTELLFSGMFFPATASTLNATLLIFGALLACCVLLVPIVLAKSQSHQLVRILFVHAYHGFYIGTLVNRFLSFFWPLPQCKKRPQLSGKKIILQTEVTLPKETVREALQEAFKRIPPLWPLSHFVAVNPFMGLSKVDFLSASFLFKQAMGTTFAMPLSFYKERYEKGMISRNDFEKARQELTSLEKVDQNVVSKDISWEGLYRLDHATTSPSSDSCSSSVEGNSWSYHNSFIVEEISKWCATYFDQGQALWGFPWKKERLFIAWKKAALLDWSPKIAGVADWSALIRHLPEDPFTAIRQAILTLEIPEEQLVEFFHSSILGLSGWAGYIQFLEHEKNLRGEKGDSLVDLLAICMVYNIAFEKKFLSHLSSENNGPLSHQKIITQTELVWQRAHECALERQLFTQLASRSLESKKEAESIPSFQALFCIDVRSEVYRRCLEQVAPTSETRGFAGFFAFPIEFVLAGEEKGRAQCPVLISPTIRVCECPDDLKQIQLQKKVSHFWKIFKSGAVSSLVFVEVAGLGFLWSILKSLFKVRKKTNNTSSARPFTIKARSMEQELALAEGALKHMGFSNQKFARIVLFCGHGSATENNPYAASLDCGACGGSSGAINARTAAAVLNKKEIRTALLKKGICIPNETYFVAALHNTTTDVVTLYDQELAPGSHCKEILSLEASLAQATLLAQQNRAPSLGLNPEADCLGKQIQAKSQDWSDVRPEWGLAGNYAFIAAPRARTRSINFEGRVFLHDYFFSQDHDGSTLSLILSAPVIVASWINLQYFASTVDNKNFGSGDKTLHNVTGLLGVLEGNGGDLRRGLPLQSLHDGEKWRHEPLRLHVCVEAPKEAIDRVLREHSLVADLVAHRWIHLFSMDETGRFFEKSDGRGGWAQSHFIEG